MSIDPQSIQQLGAIVLCGGSSTRMGYEKFKLPFAEKTFLECVAEQLLPTIAGPVVLVGNPQNVTEIRSLVASTKSLQSDRTRVVADEVDNLGPLEGIRVGLQTLQSSCDWAFVTCCDTPLIKPAFIHFLASDIEKSTAQAIIPTNKARTPQRIYGMSAIYQTSPAVLETIKSLIQTKQLRVSGLSNALDARHVSVDDIRSVDAELHSLLNLNDPTQYLEFLNHHNETCSEEVAKQLRTQ